MRKVHRAHGVGWQLQHPPWGDRPREALFPVHGDVGRAAVGQRGFVVEPMGVNGHGLSFLSVM